MPGPGHPMGHGQKGFAPKGTLKRLLKSFTETTELTNCPFLFRFAVVTHNLFISSLKSHSKRK